MADRRAIPSIDRLLERPGVAAAIDEHGRTAVVEALRRAADGWRTASPPGAADDARDPGAAIEAATLAGLAARTRPSLIPVINATGVIVHTNLGRAPLAEEAIARVAAIAAGYSNLEYDLTEGTRGRRHAHAERLLQELTGAEAALVANNNAAAALVMLAALAPGREVLVSRGELVEIGGGFRVPEILAQSGAILREVGTTNRTRTADYAAAITDRTAAILRVHPSNFRIAGFTERPTLGSLAALARQFGVPLLEDLGSGWLGVAKTPDVLRDEPSVRASIDAGVDVVAFSGDKLLGGPQSGLLVGRAKLISTIGRHPLMRAVRADKLAYAALEATLALWAREPAHGAVPVMHMLTASRESVDARSRALEAELRGIPGLVVQLEDGVSTPGGGSAPDTTIATTVVTLSAPNVTAETMSSRMRACDPPVIGRIESDRVVLDLRTVRTEDVPAIARAVSRAVRD
jgi:L-seryl-tRNA(Ser) seleniumtransferase